MPSVSAAKAVRPPAPSNAMASDSANSLLRPPRPLCFSVTVVSPPESMTIGAAKGTPLSRACWARAAWTRATSRASPSIRSDIIQGVTPWAWAAWAAAFSDRAAEAMRRVSSPPLVVPVSVAASRNAAQRGGSVMPRAATVARTAALLARPGTVGPEATAPGSSPGTSETTSDTTRAGAANSAKRPPLTRLNCLRMSFITPMGAPEARSASFKAWISLRSSPTGGAGSNDEPPPQIRAITRSSAERPLSACINASAASIPAWSGTGCAASSTLIVLQGAA